MVKCKKYGLEYGLRSGDKYEDKQTLVAVPYISSQTPHMVNEFSDPDLTILYTVMIYATYTIPKKAVELFLNKVYVTNSFISNQYLLDLYKKINTYGITFNTFTKKIINYNQDSIRKIQSDISLLTDILEYIFLKEIKVTDESINLSFINSIMKLWLFSNRMYSISKNTRYSSL
jgi:hypothetical protein